MPLAVSLGFLLLLLAMGAPIAFAMGLAGMVGLLLLGGSDLVLGILDSAPLAGVSSYELITIPMFLLMAELVLASGIADDLFKVVAAWTGRMRGGLGIATALTGAGFAAICGSSTASAATLSSTSLPAMIKHGYEPRLASGVVAVSGTLAILIPPSIALVLYGIIADANIGKLLVGGVIPGLMVTAVIIATVLYLVWRDPSRAPRTERVATGEKVRLLAGVAPMLVLFGLVTGLIYVGVATPTEAAAMGAVGALLIAFGMRMPRERYFPAFVRAAYSSCMIFTIIMGATIFGIFVAMSQATQDLSAWILGLKLAPWIVLMFFLFILIVMGCFMDQIAIMVLTVPVMLPILKTLGYDPIWFGVLFVVVAEVGMITPPVGLNCFVVARSGGQPLEVVFGGILPHVVAHILIILVFAFFPQTILWLPSRM